MSQLYEELLWRGLIKDVSDEEKAKKLLNEEKVRFYCGFDPTGQSLTVGHLVQVVRMRLLQKYGHTPVVLVGGATGLIGDPRQTSERKLLTLEESLSNAEKIRVQLSRFLDPKDTIFVNNHEWISKIDVISFLRDYGKHFNLNYMLAKETVQSRLDIGISYTEFSYMIIQAIDFMHLYETKQVKIQFGGSDQWGNITSGLELIRKTKGNHEAVGLSSPLLLKADGTKFGKSESGALWIDESLTSPYEIYQYFINTQDDEVITYLKTLTLLDREVIEDLEKEVQTNPGGRQAQKVLAKEVVTFMHGEKAYLEAIKVTEALFTGEFQDLSLEAIKALSKTLDLVEVNKEALLVDVLIDSKLASSKRESREFIQSGAVSLNGLKAQDIEGTIAQNGVLHQGYVILKRGKKKYAIAKL